MKKIICISLCVIILAASVVYCFATNTQVDGCNWMSVIDDNTSLADISMPGTHDSAATYVAFGIKARCQDKIIPEQLNCGARFLDLRLCDYKGKLKLVHNFISCRKGSGFGAPILYFEDVTAYCLDFLSKNPKECLVLCIKEDFGSSENFDSMLASYIAAHPDKWYTENRVPNLGEVRGKMVLVNRFGKANSKFTDQNGGINLTNFPDHGEPEGDFQTVMMYSYDDTMISSYTVQDRYQYAKKNKWAKAIVPTLEFEKPEGGMLINFFSTASGLSPEINANYINAQVKEYAFTETKCYGIVLFDFINEELAAKIYNCNASVWNPAYAATASTAADVPDAQHGFIKFLDKFWAFLIEKFS